MKNPASAKPRRHAVPAALQAPLPKVGADVVLHIGRHKTGTSSLQKFLDGNRDALAGRGLFYPAAGGRIAHHGIAAAFTRRVWTKGSAPQREAARNMLAALAREIEANGGQRVLLSSEAFQNADPAILATMFPPGRTRIVVYLREQVGYAISAYQQAVHAQRVTASIADYCLTQRHDYDLFLRRWEAAFGTENILVRPYDRKQLIGQDVVEDFCATIGLDATGLARFEGDANPSIGGVLLEFKRMLNVVGAGSPRAGARIYNVFSRLAGLQPAYRRKPVLSADTRQQIAATCAPGNQAVEARHFGAQPWLALQVRGDEAAATPAPVTAQDVAGILRDVARADRMLARRLVAILLTQGEPEAAPHRSIRLALAAMEPETGTLPRALHAGIAAIAAKGGMDQDPAWKEFCESVPPAAARAPARPQGPTIGQRDGAPRKPAKAARPGNAARRKRAAEAAAAVESASA